MAKKRFDERIDAQVALQEVEEGKPPKIFIEGAMTADIVNGNKRRYSGPVLHPAIDELVSHLNESAGQGRAIHVLGEAEHPSDKGGRPNLLETIVKWEEFPFDGKRLDLKGAIMETNKGKDILTLMRNGVMPGVSMRGYGEGKYVGKGDDKIFEVTELHITGFDLVLEPSFKNSATLIESQKLDDADALGENEMTEELLEKVQNEKAELQRKLDEAQKSVAEGEKVKAELEESKRSAQVAKAVEEVIQSLPFGEKLNQMFTESIKEQSFVSAQDVKTFAESKRKEYGKLAAAGVLAGMGFDEKKGIVVLGDVLELETGTPEFARASFEITESVRKFEMRSQPTRKNESRAAVFTVQLLERFDKLYQRQLMQEAQIFNEETTAAALGLPYSVSRAVIAEAFPNLIAANIFDVGLMQNSPENIYYEVFAGETGYTVAITDEVETAGVEGTWYDLAHANIVPGTVVVTSNPAGTDYVEGTDYVIDYELGKIMPIVPGSIGANDVLVDYSYNAIRQGEGAEIQQAKVTLSYQTLTAAAMRVADQINHEAIVFSRSQLGWDVVGRTMANIIRQTRLNIDRNLIEKAVEAALGVASNSGGTWVSATDAWSVFAEYLGYAKVKVANRYYEPTGILMSQTNADLLSNWDGFTRIGFPNAILDAAGFAGGVKGLPIFSSPVVRDTWALVMNREIVMHRVYQPMTIKGPFPTYGSNHKLIAAEQYYSEEYNGSIAPIGGKAAYVKIT